MPAAGAGAQVAAAAVADVACGQAEQLEGGGVGREVAASLGDLAQLEVDRLVEGGGVDDLADLGREPQERRELLSRRSPGLHHARVAVAPLELEGVQRL